jgi:hypothetical protein
METVCSHATLAHRILHGATTQNIIDIHGKRSLERPKCKWQDKVKVGDSVINCGLY